MEREPEYLHESIYVKGWTAELRNILRQVHKCSCRIGRIVTREFGRGGSVFRRVFAFFSLVKRRMIV